MHEAVTRLLAGYVNASTSRTTALHSLGLLEPDRNLYENYDERNGLV